MTYRVVSVLLLLGAACGGSRATPAGAVKSYSFKTKFPERLGETWKEAERQVSFDLVHVPAECCGMIPFWIGKTEVTYENYGAFWQDPSADETTAPSLPFEPPELWGGVGYDAPRTTMGTGTHPALAMRRYAAERYCVWLERKTGRRFRLPTEREWELACRWHATPSRTLEAVAWHAGNSGYRTHPTGTLSPNGLGLHDMLGNVWEFCLEPYTPGGFEAVLRGGSFATPRQQVGPSSRITTPKKWYWRDPERPRSQWWLVDGQEAGFRIVALADETPRAEQEAYFPKLRFEDVTVQFQPGFETRVSGTVVNGGDRTIVELEARMAISPDDGRFTPVLVNGYHPGKRRQPLRPGEHRRFEEVIWCHYGDAAGPLGVKVTAVQFARE